MTKGRWVWVSRDDRPGANYVLWRFKPVWDDDDKYVGYGYWLPNAREPGPEDLAQFCGGEWQRVTRFRLAPGECKRIRISIEAHT